MSKYEDCSYGGEFYCHHVYNPESPWLWVDFRFFHSTSKKYFAVAMTTATYSEYERGDEIVRELDGPFKWKESRAEYDERESRVSAALLKYFEHPKTTNANFEIKDYGLPVIGIWAVIDAPFIDENEIRKFIAFFRSLGEPSEPGYKWIGEEIQVDPKTLIRRTQAS